MARRYDNNTQRAPQQPSQPTPTAEAVAEVLEQPTIEPVESTEVTPPADDQREDIAMEVSEGEEGEVDQREDAAEDSATLDDADDTQLEEPAVEETPPVPEPGPTPTIVPEIAPVVETPVEPNLQEQYSVDEQTLIEFFQDYAKKMAKGRPVTPADIATNQVAWFRKVMVTLELDPKSFRRVMDFLMAHILEEMDGAYHPARRMRGMTAQLRLNDRERVQFQVLMQLFCDMADPVGRDAMRSQTSAEKALGNGLSETARARLSDYFRLG